MSWDTSSIDAMIETAKGEADQDCSVKINGKWLCVTVGSDSVTYQYGKKFISRNAAIELLKQK